MTHHVAPPLLVLLALALLLQCELLGAAPDVSAVSRCLSKKLDGKKYRTAKSKAFHLNYGLSGVEMFNVLSPKQMKEVEVLDECVQSVFPGHFVLTEPESDHFYKFGGGNATFLTEIFQFVLPDVAKSLLRTAGQALKEADWSETQKAFGIRSAYLTSFVGRSLKEHQEEMEASRPPEAMVFASAEIRAQKERDRRLAILQARKIENERMQKHLQVVPHSSYVLVVPLSDRNSYIAGSVLIRPMDTDATGEPDDQYDDEDSDVQDGARLHKPISLAFSAGDVETLTPEKGSLLLLPARMPHGFDEVTFGARKMLVIELWHFRDAPLSVGRATVAMGEQLGLVDEGHEL